MTTPALSWSAEPVPVKVRLEVYEAPGVAAACGMERALRRALPRALGYDPFDAGAAKWVRVQMFTRPPGDLMAYMEFRQPDGTTLWQRVYWRPIGDCAGLLDAMLLGLEIALGEEEYASASPPSAACPPPEACPPCPQQACPPAPKPEPRPKPKPELKPEPKPEPRPPARIPPIAWSISMGGEALFGPLPGITGAGTLGVAFRTPFVTVGLEGRIGGPAVMEVPQQGTVFSFLSTGVLVPCLRGWVFEACAAASLGALRALGQGVDVPAGRTFLYLAAGPRLAALVPLGERFLLRPYVEVTFPIVPISLALQERQTWISPTSAAILGVSMAMNLTPP